MSRLKRYWLQACSDWNFLFKEELRMIFKDTGVLIFFFLVPLGYPLLYSFIYTRETLRDVPVVAVDLDRSSLSRDFMRRLDATPDVRIVSNAASMDEARALVKGREAYGIVEVPADFTRRLAKGEQASVGAYCDMSGMLYYKAVLSAATNVSLDMNAEIKVKRAARTTEAEERVVEHPIAYEEVNLYNPQGGFATFLIPAVLVLIIQQTLLLGVGLSAGTAREHNRFRRLIPIDARHTGLLRIVLSKAMAYTLVYLPILVYVFGVVPQLFTLPQIGRPLHLALFLLPYLLACVFFAMTVSVLVRHRETCIMLIVFSSVPLLFISGISWPGSAVPAVWEALSYVFPSTFGIHGFVAVNNMGARLIDVRPEWNMLWIQAVIYFFTTCVVYRHTIRTERRKSEKGDEA